MHVLRRMPWPASTADPQTLVMREWLVTNGLGGYASGSIAGIITRRYHGLLVAALPGPWGRMVMLTHLEETLRLADGRRIRLSGHEHSGELLQVHVSDHLAEFAVEDGLPVWRYRVEGIVLEKRVVLPHMQNTVHVSYRVTDGDGLNGLELRPSVNFRRQSDPVNSPLASPYRLTAVEDRYELAVAGEPVLRMQMCDCAAAFTVDGRAIRNILYRVEQSRGYDAVGDLWTPGVYSVDIEPGRTVTLMASTEPWEIVRALAPELATSAERERRGRLIGRAHTAAKTGVAAELVLAADQFLITPAGRAEETARAHASGDEVRTVVAGYHWFTDWGRDTMISLEGLTLTTGRHVEAGYILRTFAHYIRDGLIPNLFPEAEKEGLYHTADATLWYFHAIDRYLQASHDTATLVLLLPRLRDVIAHHLRGTRFGISVDPADGLLRQGEEGYQLTWMDAKVDDWVVTPRRGKAVEINALWYNALRLMEGWVRSLEGESAAREYGEQAARAYSSFNERFWYAPGGHLFDVVDGEHGDDAACRPNQVIAISLPHPVLDPSRWASVLDVVEKRLVTPVGLRSLAPGEHDYKAQYYGDLRARDAAYHQGTVWAWLIGPFVDAWLKVHPHDLAGARRFLEGFPRALDEACVGTIAEIFDAQAPYTPRGCVAQAWSVAEVLRCWVKTGADTTRENAAPEVLAEST